MLAFVSKPCSIVCMKRVTASERWLQGQTLAQEYADDKICKIYPEIVEGNNLLKWLYKENASPSTIQEAVQYLTKGLDCEWPYLDDDMLVSGVWHRGKLSIEDTEEGYQLSRVFDVIEPVHRVAKSLGFIATQDSRSSPPTLKLKFDPGERGSKSVETPLGRHEISFQSMAFGNIDELSLSPIFDIEPADISEISERIYEAEAWYHERTREGSKFYELSSARQYGMFEKVTNLVHDAMPLPASRTHLLITAAAPFLYYEAQDDHQPAVSSSEAGKSYEITGTVLGVSLINAWQSVRGGRMEANQRRLHEREDLLDPDTGICLVVEPSVDMSESPLYLPYNATDFDLALEGTK